MSMDKGRVRYVLPARKQIPTGASGVDSVTRQAIGHWPQQYLYNWKDIAAGRTVASAYLACN